MAGKTSMEELSTNAASSLPRIGSYRLVKPLGSGGMSSVFRARHVETDFEVAVKILPRSLARNPTLLQRFIREAKSAESLEHPSIVAIYDRGFDDGRYYLVLELVAGGDLHDFVRNHGTMSPSEATRVIRAAVEGLRYAADLGVIHRDVKPANLLLTEDGKVKVTDLGLALQMEDEDERVTRDGTTVGTVDYMAPEQARDSRATSVRSDIYSLGCTFYYLLTGLPPFPGGDVPDKLRRHAIEPPPDIRKHRAEVSPHLAQLIRRMMAKNPDNRYADYPDLISALDSLTNSTRDDSDGFPALVPLEDDTTDPRANFEVDSGRPSDTSRIPPGSTIETRTSYRGSRPAGSPHAAFPTPRSLPANELRTEQNDSPLLRQMLDEEEAEAGLPPQTFGSSGAYGKQSESLGPYILRGAVIGIAVAAGFLGLRALVSTLNVPPSVTSSRDDSPNQTETKDVLNSTGDKK